MILSARFVFVSYAVKTLNDILPSKVTLILIVVCNSYFSITVRRQGYGCGCSSRHWSRCRGWHSGCSCYLRGSSICIGVGGGRTSKRDRILSLGSCRGIDIRGGRSIDALKIEETKTGQKNQKRQSYKQYSCTGRDSAS